MNPVRSPSRMDHHKFVGHVDVRDMGKGRWKLLAPLVYKGRNDTFVVGADAPDEEFITDFASVPRILTWLIPKQGRYTKAAILHDFLCREAKKRRKAEARGEKLTVKIPGYPDREAVDRKDADGLFRSTMRTLDVPVLRRWVMWAAVRLGDPLALLRSGAGQVLLVLLWAIPALAFLLVPTLVVGVWLLMAYLLEFIALGVRAIFRRGESHNVPSLALKA